MVNIAMKSDKPLWVPLHVHTEYSALDGAIRIPDYYKFAVEHELPAAAVTDHFVMSSFAEVDRTFKDVKPIFGCELYSDSLLKGGPAVPFKGRRRYHLNAFALNKKGVINLQKLAAKGYCADNEAATGPFAVTRDGIEAFHEGIAFGSACLSGELSVLLGAGLQDKADEWLDTFDGIIGKDNLYVELLDISYAEQDEMNRRLMDFAKSRGLHTIVTTDSHYMPNDVSWYNALVASQKKQSISGEGDTKGGDLAERFNKWDITGQMDLSMRTPEQIWARWKYVCPEAVAETVRLAERAERYTLKGDSYMLPHMGCGADGFRDRAYRGLDGHLAELGLNKSAGTVSDYHSALARELDVVSSMGFVEYFLLVEDLVRACRDKGIKVGPGRGSAAGSMLAWSLGITQINPKRYGLLFERFLNPERVSMPDIDIDFEDDRRGEAISYLKARYGDASVVPIANYSRCKWKVGIRDAARVLGTQPWQGDALVKSLESVIDTSYTSEDDEDAFQLEANITSDYLYRFICQHTPKAAELGLDKIHEILELAGHFNGILRNYGKHASGIVISPGRADDYVPLGRIKGAISSQYNMEDIDYIKLVKVDILGLSTLSMIKEMETGSIEVAGKCGMPSPSLEDFITYVNTAGNISPSEFADSGLIDKGLTKDSLTETFQMFAEGRTTGVFQFAGSGMRSLLRKIRPGTIEDLSSAVALFRPGPLQSGITDNYIKAGNGSRINTGDAKRKTFPASMDKEIQRIAGDTRGQIIYQEHIMKIAQNIAGYTLGEADILRKAIGKKKIEIMQQERIKFIDKCAARNYSKADAEMAFDTIEFFAGYGFNKSHSVCYAVLAFITAWYAANRPAAFWTALINDTAKKQRKDVRGQIKLSPIIREAKESCTILPPLYMESDSDSKSMFNYFAKTNSGLDYKDVWKHKNCWAIRLGTGITKGAGAGGKCGDVCDAIGVTQFDDLYSFVRKAALAGNKQAVSSTSQYFLNGYFDIILCNTARRYKYNIEPVYLRMAILSLADTENMPERLKDAIIRSSMELAGSRKTISGNGLPFQIIKSRSVWGSYLTNAVDKIAAKTKRIKSPWKQEDIEVWLGNSFKPVLDALMEYTVQLRVKMLNDPSVRLSNMLSLYRVEKNDFGEAASIPDWRMAAELTGWTFQLFADEAVEYIQSKWNRFRYRDIIEADDGSIAEKDDIEKLSTAGGVWILGQFVSAAWRGADRGGYITMEGRFGQKSRMLYIKLNERLPIINIDAIKKLQAIGGYIAVKAVYDEQRNGFTIVPGKGTALPDVSGGFEDLTDSIAILPLMYSRDDNGAHCILRMADNGICGRFDTSKQTVMGTRSVDNAVSVEMDKNRLAFYRNLLWSAACSRGEAVKVLSPNDSGGWTVQASKYVK